MLSSIAFALTTLAAVPGVGPHAEQAAPFLGGDAPSNATWSEGAPPVAAAPRLARRVYGYLPFWLTIDPAKLRWDLLSDILHFSADLAEDGRVTSTHGWTATAGATTSPLVELAHRNGARAHLCAVLFDSGGSLGRFLSSATARANAIKNLVDLVQRVGGDGINIDFEFVTSPYRTQFNTFITDAATALHAAVPGAELTIAMPAYPPWYPGYDIAALGAAADRLLVMTYDYHWAGIDRAGPVAPLTGGSKWSTYVKNSIGGPAGYLTKVPADKVVMGVNYYGYDWPTQSTTTVPSPTTARAMSVLYKDAVGRAATNGRKWDTESQTPWYSYTSAGTAHQAWYDDVESLKLKYDYANQSDLGGIMIWALGYDDGRAELWDAIEEKFGVAPAADGGAGSDAGAEAPPSADGPGGAEGATGSDATASDGGGAPDGGTPGSDAAHEGGGVAADDAGCGCAVGARSLPRMGLILMATASIGLLGRRRLRRR